MPNSPLFASGSEVQKTDPVKVDKGLSPGSTAPTDSGSTTGTNDGPKIDKGLPKPEKGF